MKIQIIELSRAELLVEKDRLDVHIEQCCGAQDGSCRQLERLGEVQYLLGEDRPT